MEHFCLYSLVSMVLVAKAENIVIASLNGQALFHCGDSEVNPKSSLRVRWVKYASDVRRIILSKPSVVTIPDDERAAWMPDGNRNLSLSLTKLQKSDEGLYSCEIWRDWKCIHVQNMSLVLKDCKSLTVKVVPGTPINLACPMDRATQPGHTDVSWMMLKAAKPVPITLNMTKVNRTLLSFGSVDGMDKHWYRCNYTLGRVSHCYDICLLVIDQAPTPSQDLLATPAMESRDQKEEVQHSIKALAAGLTVTGAAVAVAVAGCIMYSRRSRLCNHTAAPPAQGYLAGPWASFVQPCSTDYNKNDSNSEDAENEHSTTYEIITA